MGLQKPMTDLSHLPSIDHLLHEPKIESAMETFGRDFTLKALRTVLSEIRSSVITEGIEIPDKDEIARRMIAQLDSWVAPTLLPVINATGVVLHTNLGRAPLSKETQQAMVETVNGYSNLEFDLEIGKRGKRSVHASRLLTLLTDTEGGFVVNNNAGAVLLVLSALAASKNVLVSRTQLVEIGGGFRIPDVMRQSGANLVEIGTTNRVHLYDFENALKSDEVALVLIAHHSNFKLIGFHSEPELKEIVEIAHQYKVPIVHDLGSGALLDTAPFGLSHEPTVQESVSAGCDLVCFSGDKLLGGPQAGIIIGKEALLKPVRVHPLTRALRPDKLTLSGLTATLTHYLKGEALAKVPIWQMISRPTQSIKATAEHWREKLGVGEVVEGCSTVGGGSLPTEEMATFLLALDLDKPDAFLHALRQLDLPIVARVENNRVLFDPRTVFPEQELQFLRQLERVLSEV